MVISILNDLKPNFFFVLCPLELLFSLLTHKLSRQEHLDLANSLLPKKLFLFAKIYFLKYMQHSI